MSVTFPGESADDRTARARLLDEEIELRRHGASRRSAPGAAAWRRRSGGLPLRGGPERWGSELLYAPTDPGQDPRLVGTIEPLWNLFDFTPEGRPTDWEEQLTYS